MKVLVVGAGAVGQTFGYHLQKGGSEVHFFVKPAYADAARAGYTLYDMGHGGAESPVRFDGFGVQTDVDAVRAEGFDLVLVTVSSTALKSGSWLEELVQAVPEATIVGLQASLGDPDFVKGLAGADRVAWGVIELIAYQAPLPGETLPEPGVAFWIPRLLVFPFSGPDARVQPLVAAFRAGGLRAKQAKDVISLTAVGAPAMNLHIAALESVGWSLSVLSADHELLALTGRAVREASAAAAQQHGISVPVWVRWLRPWHLRAVAWLGPRLAPLDLEGFLKYHFTKVGDQTRQSLALWIAAAEAQGQSAVAMRALRDRRESQAGQAA